jgi:PPK2 family polyphosphate:nucleotide phosphotransferase
MAALVDRLRVEPGSKVKLVSRKTDSTLGLTKEQGRDRLASLHTQLFDLQARLWAEQKHALLVVLQAMDAGGKDGTIRSVFTGVNPQGVNVQSFKVPAGHELLHDYLWRVHAVAPAKGEIGIFNRSHYEDVLVVRVHEIVPEDHWRKRYRHLRDLERMLTDEGTTVVKIFLNISKDEQRQRQQERVDDPAKQWKFRPGDLEDRAKWDQFMDAYEEAINETVTDYAPWYVVPADRNWVRNVAVSSILVHHLEQLDPQYPPAAPGIVGTKVV